MKLTTALLLAVPAIAGRCQAPAHGDSHHHSRPSHPSSSAPAPPAQSQLSPASSDSAAPAGPTASFEDLLAVPTTVSSSAAAAVTSESSVTSTESATVPETTAPATTDATTDATAVTTATTESTTQTTTEVTTETTTQATTTTSSAASSATSSIWDYLGTASYSGSSTWYGGNLNGGACSFTTLSSLPAGIYGTAYSGAVWDNAAECGACIEVVGPSGATIKAMIVDECPECEQGHLDLFPDAFTAVGGTDGIVATTYRFVECGITSPLVLHNKSGTSQYWFAMQVVNASEPVASLEVSTDGGNTWTATTRTTYNYFEYAAGFRSASMDIRVTSITGATVVYSGATPDAEAQFTTSANF